MRRCGIQVNTVEFSEPLVLIFRRLMVPLKWPHVKLRVTHYSVIFQVIFHAWINLRWLALLCTFFIPGQENINKESDVVINVYLHSVSVYNILSWHVYLTLSLIYKELCTLQLRASLVFYLLTKLQKVLFFQTFSNYKSIQYFYICRTW